MSTFLFTIFVIFAPPLHSKLPNLQHLSESVDLVSNPLSTDVTVKVQCDKEYYDPIYLTVSAKSTIEVSFRDIRGWFLETCEVTSFSFLKTKNHNTQGK